MPDERPLELRDVIRLLRSTKARRYTKVEVPFVTGIRKSIAACIDDCC